MPNNVNKELSGNLHSALSKAIDRGWIEEVDEENKFFVYSRWDDDSCESNSYKQSFTYDGAVATLVGDPTKVVVKREVVEISEPSTEEVERSLADKFIKYLNKHFGDNVTLSKEFELDPKDVPITKQFHEEERIEYAPLYVPPSTPDLVGDAMKPEAYSNMIKQLKENIDNGIRMENLGHKVPVSKDAWEYIDVFESPWPSCTVGDTEVVEGQGVLVIKYHNERAWELRKEGVIKGPSIGGKGRFVENSND